MISIDLSDIYRKAFGIELFDNVIYPQISQKKDKANINYSDIEKVYTAQSGQKSWLGIPVMMPVKFKGGTFNTLNKGKIETVSLADYRLPDTTLVDFSRSKNIVTTPINGGSGTVKELYSFEDWSIKIYGIITQTDVDIYEQLTDLLQWENITDAIRVNSAIFELLGITDIIIKGIDLPQLKGQDKVRPFQLECESIEPLELVL